MTRCWLALAALCSLLCLPMLSGCGGGNVDDDEPSQMPCKYRPDCTPGPPISARLVTGLFTLVVVVLH